MSPWLSKCVRRVLALLVCLPLVATTARAEDNAKPAVNNLHDLAEALSTCVQRFAVKRPYLGIQLTARIGFDVRGQPLGPPLFTYITPNAPDRIKRAYKNAVSEALKRCTPLSFSRKLGATIAGVPLVLRFNERGLVQAGLAESSGYVAAAPAPSSEVPPARSVRPMMQPPTGQQRYQRPPIWLPGLANPVPNPPPGPGPVQDRQARCILQARLYSVPAVDMPQYLGLCSQ
jgi:hypothetical protein